MVSRAVKTRGCQISSQVGKDYRPLLQRVAKQIHDHQMGHLQHKYPKDLAESQLAKKPIECLEYVILHELAHLKVKNHGPEFVAVLDQHMPQWQERKKLLNESKLDYMDSHFEK